MCTLYSNFPRYGVTFAHMLTYFPKPAHSVTSLTFQVAPWQTTGKGSQTVESLSLRSCCILLFTLLGRKSYCWSGNVWTILVFRLTLWVVSIATLYFHMACQFFYHLCLAILGCTLQNWLDLVYDQEFLFHILLLNAQDFYLQCKHSHEYNDLIEVTS